MLNEHTVLEIRKSLGLNQSSFGRKIGYSREVVSKIENGKMEPSKWFIEAVMELQNSSKVVQDSSDVTILSKISHSQKNSPKNYTEERLLKKQEHSSFLVPLIGIKAQAGYIKGFEQVDYMDTLEQYSLPPGVNPIGAVWRYFEIDGDSMEPTFSAGDVVLTTMVPHEDWNDIKNFCVYVILTADQLLIKRLYKKSDDQWVLVSDNEEEAPQVLIDKKDVLQLWQLRRHIRSKAPAPKEFKITA